MKRAYTIKDAAERSGFSATTLRYYESIGLLPESTRTPGGYRTYDNHTLDRLAFIARAKQLGCSLDEIADLALAWDGGTCGPVQDRLRTAVAAKLTTAQQQIVELVTLTSELRQAAASLEAHRPDGPCDDSCGCISAQPEPAQPATAQMVTVGAKPAPLDSVQISCGLGSASIAGRLDEWQRMLLHVAHRQRIEDGVRVVFTQPLAVEKLMRLVTAEQECCQFIRFAITVDTRGVGLEVTAPTDALAIVESLLGTPT